MSGADGAVKIPRRIGDSFKDTTILTEAQVGFLFRAPDNVKRQFAQFKAVETYEDVMKSIRAAMT